MAVMADHHQSRFVQHDDDESRSGKEGQGPSELMVDVTLRGFVTPMQARAATSAMESGLDMGRFHVHALKLQLSWVQCLPFES